MIVYVAVPHPFTPDFHVPVCGCCSFDSFAFYSGLVVTLRSLLRSARLPFHSYVCGLFDFVAVFYVADLCVHVLLRLFGYCSAFVATRICLPGALRLRFTHPGFTVCIYSSLRLFVVAVVVAVDSLILVVRLRWFTTFGRFFPAVTRTLDAVSWLRYPVTRVYGCLPSLHTFTHTVTLPFTHARFVCSPFAALRCVFCVAVPVYCLRVDC